MRIIGFVTLCAVLGAAAGCQPIAAILDKVPGDPVISALYVPTHDNLLVIVEDYQNPALIEETAEHIDWLVANEFIEHKVAPVINPSRLTALRTSDPQAYRKLKIPQIGTELGARQVLYANVTDFVVQAAVGTDALKAHAEARVKIVDCASGQTRGRKTRLRRDIRSALTFLLLWTIRTQAKPRFAPRWRKRWQRALRRCSTMQAPTTLLRRRNILNPTTNDRGHSPQKRRKC